MDINPDKLPVDSAVLQQMVLGLLAEGGRLRQAQHLLEQLLRARYGPRRERVSENQLFPSAATILGAGPLSRPHRRSKSPS